jgi:hypothetical protein
MTRLFVVAVASIVVLSGSRLGAQELSRYRDYALESSVTSVATVSKARESETRTLYERPAKIQQLEWRAPYVPSGTEMADPVHDVLFSFCDDQLYQVVVTYDRDRMEGLTTADVLASLSATYGVPGRKAAGPSAVPIDLPPDTIVVARWEDAASLVILTRGSYSPQFQLMLISKALNTRARAAIKQALRLDTQEAPQRERDQRKKESADALAASQKARVVNRAAFRP